MNRLPLAGLALAALLVAVAPTPPAAALDLGEATAELAKAKGELESFESALKSSKSNNDDLIATLTALAEYYHKLPAAPPADPAAAAPTPEETKLYTEVAKWKDQADDAFLKAFAKQSPDRNKETNLREDVAVKAAVILGETKNPKLAEKIIGVIERTLHKSDTVTSLLWEAGFAALGKLNQESSLKWMLDNYTHTKSSPPAEIDKLVAAHKAMILFTEVKGPLRLEIVKTMVTRYAATESSAEKMTNDPKVQAVKQFWDRIKTDAIAVVKLFAKEPTKDESGALIDTMIDFQEWLRDHDSPKKDPWVGVWPEKPAEGTPPPGGAAPGAAPGVNGGGK